MLATAKPTFRQRMHDFKDSFLRNQGSLEETKAFPKLKHQANKVAFSVVDEKKIKGKRTKKAKCQIVRSASNWSIGLKEKNHEASILNAYVAMILAAEHFIYIENQFFISSVSYTKDNPVINPIANALFMRIIKAVKDKKKFKVIVVMPLLPVNIIIFILYNNIFHKGFEGDVYSNNSGLLKIQLYYEFQTISRGGHSLYQMLSEEFKKLKEKNPNIGDPREYISFYGLRNHTIMNGKPVTEIIYVHSKVNII